MLCKAQGDNISDLLEKVMHQLTWDRLQSFLDGQDTAAQVHAVGILQNVAHSSSDDVCAMADAFGGMKKFLEALERLLAPAMPVAVGEHALYTLNNLATTDKEARDLLMAQDSLLAQVLDCVVGRGGGWRVVWACGGGGCAVVIAF